MIKLQNFENKIAIFICHIQIFLRCPHLIGGEIGYFFREFAALESETQLKALFKAH